MKEAIDQMERITEITPEAIFVDKGYRGHNYQGSAKDYFPGQYKKKGASPRRWFKRRSSIEAKVSHTKHKNRLSKNYLKGQEGYDTNAILAACGQDLRLILRSISFWLKIILGILFKIFDEFIRSNEQQKKM
ncbi:MAG: hypothetical protein H0Z30_11290 [Candidatus Marinimicrobia bacterium]|nr:hypothetical protein [Candidatus Neomarinimicrobiota bacterium]